MRTVNEIESEIQKLEEKLKVIEGRPTEVYTRIVGYYRSLRNWNRGKREEYSHRVLFDLEAAPAGRRVPDFPPAAPVTGNVPQAERYIYFFRESCPNCPPVKTLLSEIGVPGAEMNVDTDEGTRAALEYGIYAAPTVIFFDSRGEVVYRASSAAELSGLKIPQMA